jgi:hypothetical protein
VQHEIRWNPRSDRYWSLFGPSIDSWSGWRTVQEPNRPVIIVSHLAVSWVTRPAANTMFLAGIASILQCICSVEPTSQFPQTVIAYTVLWCAIIGTIRNWKGKRANIMPSTRLLCMNGINHWIQINQIWLEIDIVRSNRHLQGKASISASSSQLITGMLSINPPGARMPKLIHSWLVSKPAEGHTAGPSPLSLEWAYTN